MKRLKWIILSILITTILCYSLGYPSNRIKRDEGLRLRAYQDTVGIWTIGYGHTQNVSSGDVITLHLAEQLFLHDLEVAEAEASIVIPHYEELPNNVQNVFVNMCFQMGGLGVYNFTKMIEAIEVGDWPLVVEEMLDSKWAKYDSPSRARRLAKVIKSEMIW